MKRTSSFISQRSRRRARRGKVVWRRASDEQEDEEDVTKTTAAKSPATMPKTIPSDKEKQVPPLDFNRVAEASKKPKVRPILGQVQTMQRQAFAVGDKVEAKCVGFADFRTATVLKVKLRQAKKKRVERYWYVGSSETRAKPRLQDNRNSLTLFVCTHPSLRSVLMCVKRYDLRFKE